MLKLVGTLFAIAAIIGGIITFRLYAHERSLEVRESEVAAGCEGDAACLGAVETHYEACHEELYDWQAMGNANRGDTRRRQPRPQSTEAVKSIEILHCVRERAGLDPETDSPVSP